jgi:RimJ/RimL family protein N-acetyltransferase
MIETERLILRRWADADRAPFHAMCNDPAVMEHLGAMQSRADTDAAVDRQNALIDDIGYAFWAVERSEDHAFIGFCGVKPGTVGPIDGRLEIGWRLARAAWGNGYACEAAEASLDWCVAHLDQAREDGIWAITVPANVRSWGLMERLCMVRLPELDFDHPLPGLPEHLKRHITYRKCQIGRASCRERVS